ncbi:arginine N-succinyltransferase [Sandarakinorhabdus oryzae]|uniref:arginine N-succinyltransferase n=1 Tax=Sandarakinorhabdus oryzae TaxID=2675220 RepID=UPI0012E10390|nr:arginine N-succinyltransferase [Sandarakinorhabdus oryzae]
MGLWRVRPARMDDLPAVLELARLTGGGFTNLPQDEGALARRLAWSDASFARTDAAPENELYLLLLEEVATGRIGGTGMVFSRVGAEWPFYSYKISTLTQTSKELDRTLRIQFLSLTSDFDGASEVGGLFLHPDLRTGGLGRLLARARYLFIAQHRARFGDRVIAELRGVMDESGNSPFWDALGRQFFDLSFPEADRFNAVHGNQFIADLMPKHPIYTALLPEAARAAIGQPHPTGRAALAMLLAEGFSFDNYVDIFDGGPTVSARIDDLKTIRGAGESEIAALADTIDAPAALVASGTLHGFQAFLSPLADAGRTLPAAIAEPLGLTPGTRIRHVAC